MRRIRDPPWCAVGGKDNQPFQEFIMSALKITIHSTGIGTCCLTGKEVDGLTVSFDDGTARESFLSWKGFKQICTMKLPSSSAKSAVPFAAAVSGVPAPK